MTSKNFNDTDNFSFAHADAEENISHSGIFPAWTGAYNRLRQQSVGDNAAEDATKVLDALMKAAEHGNKPAMINGFDILWQAGEHEKALQWLELVNRLMLKNVKCLWNEAMLHFFGNEIAGSPVKKDKLKALHILQYIVEHYYDFKDDDELHVVQKAYIFMLKHSVHECGALPLCSYELWKAGRRDNSENYSETGLRWCRALEKCRELPAGKGAGRIVFNCLDELYMDDMWLLEHDAADTCGFFVRKGEKNRTLDGAVRASVGCMGAWQSYLFLSSVRIKNTGKTPVFSSASLAEKPALPENYKIEPSVMPQTGERNSFVIECTWLGDDQSLFREKSVIRFDSAAGIPVMHVLSQESI